jgi:hypothetical protein
MLHTYTHTHTDTYIHTYIHKYTHTHLWLYHRKRKENKEISLYVNNKPLEQVQEIKYLGIIIDSKLNFREHIMYI